MGLMQELFGSSSDDDSESDCTAQQQQQPCGPVVRSSSVIPGLSLVRGFLSGAQQDAFRKHLESELGPGSNQAMRFGDLPLWAQYLADLVQAAAAAHALLPPEVASRVPLFDQMIVNLYRPGEGIRPHVDLLRFEDGICSVSFGDPVVMAFTEDTGDEQSRGEHQVLLQGGDLLLLHSAARYGWRHGIAAVPEERYDEALAPWDQRPGACGEQAVSGDGAHAAGASEMGEGGAAALGGALVVRGTRLSVTLRRMCSGIVLSEAGGS